MNEEYKKKLMANGVDFDRTMERFIGNEDLYEKFLLKFINDKSYTHMLDMIASGNVEESFKAAHTLKGVAANLGLDNLFHATVPLVELFRAGSMEGYGPLLEKVSIEYNSICSVINNN